MRWETDPVSRYTHIYLFINPWQLNTAILSLNEAEPISTVYNILACVLKNSKVVQQNNNFIKIFFIFMNYKSAWPFWISEISHANMNFINDKIFICLYWRWSHYSCLEFYNSCHFILKLSRELYHKNWDRYVTASHNRANPLRGHMNS